MGVWPTLILKPTAVDQAAIFNNSEYLTNASDASYEVQDFEYKVRLECLNDSNFKTFGSVAQNIAPFSDDRTGWYIRINSSGTISIFCGTGSGFSFFGFNSNNSIANDNVRDIVIKRINQNWTLEVDSSGEAITLTGTQTTIGFSSFGFLFGGWKSSDVVQASNKYIGNLELCEYYELNGSGTRINQLIKLDINSGDINTIPNIGTDKPATSDMTWNPAGSGTYVNI